MNNFDVIIIGVGQAGAPLAHEFANRGHRVAIIERQYAGGSCVNYGCTPTKAMIASAKAAYHARNAGKLGIEIPAVEVNFGKVIKRRDYIVENSRRSLQDSLQKAENIEYIEGEASFSGRKEIIVRLDEGGERKLKAEKIFINTGTSPRIPKIEGIEDVNYYTARTMMNLKELPEHLIIIGGSYIGAEFGQAYSRFGCKVTILESSEQLIGREDEDIAEEVQDILSREGIDIFLKARIQKIRNKGSKINLQFKSNDEEISLNASHLLIGAGTKPNTDVLNLDVAGIETDDQGYIKVDHKLQTNVEGVYALGDVKGGPEFTHISYDDYRIVSQNILHKGNRSINDRMIPYTMFTDPQLGRVGLNEKMAAKKDINYKTAIMQMENTARGKETGNDKGFMKVLINPDDDTILGASMLMSEGGEIMAVIETAMMGKLKYTELRDGVFAHPTYAESLNNLFTNLK